MLIPDRLRALIDDGIVHSIVRPLKSGKEASVFIVTVDDGMCAAKVYKEAEKRNFRQRQDYVEGRRVGDSRQQRAMTNGSRFGKKQSEAAWQTSESAAMHRLFPAGVRIPRPRQMSDGVLLMDLVLAANGEPAPQIATLRFSREEATRLHYQIVTQIARMLCAGLVHADLSEYNILAAFDGPMIIDFPQATDAARNTNAKRLLLRDVANITRFFSRFAPELRRTEYGQEMWLLHERTTLRPDTVLTGRFAAARGVVDTELILREIEAAKQEAAKREEIRQLREAKKRPPVGGSGR